MANRIPISNFLRMTPQVPQYSAKNQNYLIAGANPISYLDDGTQEEQAGPLAASVDWAQINSAAVAQGVKIYRGAGGLNASESYGQSFVGLGQTLSTVRVPVKKTGTPASGYVYATIYASTGAAGSVKPTGAAIATSGGIGDSSFTTSYVMTSFSFTGANAIVLTAGVTYVMVVEYLYGDISNYLTIGTSTGLAGNASYSNDNTTWTVDATQDLLFYINSTILGSTIEGNVIHAVASSEGTYSIYIITDTTAVYGIVTTNGIPTAITSLGYPVSVQSGIVNAHLSIGGGNGTNVSGYLFATYGGTQLVYSMPLPSGSWSATGAVLNVGRHIMEPFLNFIAIENMNAFSGNPTYPSLVSKFDTTAFTISTGIDLGTGFGVMKLQNYNDKYLAIAGGKTTTGVPGFVQNYIFLWDGISSRYNYSLRIPGQFIDMKVIDSILYVAVKVGGGKTCLYYMAGTSLKKVTTTQFSQINSTIVRSQNLCSLFNFNNYVGMNLVSNSDLNYPIQIHGQDEIGPISFIHSSGRQFDQFCVGFDGTLFATKFVGGSNSVLYYLPITGAVYQNILYKSQWIPVKNLQTIEIHYDSPPTGSDEIDVTIYGKGENIISGTSTDVLTPITATSALNSEYTALDCPGFVGDRVRVVLSTVFTSTKPIVRDIVLITE